MKKYSSLRKGFTLVELMIVIAIIGILAAVLYPSLTGYLERTRDTNRQKALNNYALSLTSHNMDHGSYPKTDMCADDLYGVGTNAGPLRPYMKGGLKDPKNGNGAGNCAAKWGYSYKALKIYATDDNSTKGAAYAIAANMENWSNANFDAINANNWTSLAISTDKKLTEPVTKQNATDTFKKGTKGIYYVVTN